MHLLHPYLKISTGSDETSSAINILRQYRPSISLDNRLYHYPRIPHEDISPFPFKGFSPTIYRPYSYCGISPPNGIVVERS